MKLKSLFPHFVAVLIFVAIGFFYASPVLNGKRLQLHDTMQAQAAAQELNQYHEQTGEWAWWTNRMFGGMPGYFIAGDYPYSLPTKIGRFLDNVLPVPINLFLLLMLGCYVLLQVLRVDRWLSVLGAIAFCFGTYNLVFLKAGHISKVLAVGYAPLVLAGFVLCFRGKYLLGAALTALFLSLELYANHLQITYFLFMLLGIYALVEGINLLKNGKTVELAKIAGVLVLAGLLAAGTHSMRLWNNYTYSKESTRGKSELTIGTEKTTEGLGRDYAFAWSHGVAESFTLLIPNFSGAGAKMDTKSQIYKTLTDKGVDAATAEGFVQQVPLYFGAMDFAAGPAYSGAIVCFLFVFAMFFLKNRIKWTLFGVAVLYLFFAWGSNFETFNYLMFEYFPYFNKFRDNKMVLNIQHLAFVVIGFLGLKQLVEEKNTFSTLKKTLLYSLGIVGGLTLIAALMPSVLVDFKAKNDTQLLDAISQQVGDKTFAQQIMNAIVQDRQNLLQADAWRSLIFVLLAAVALWLFSNQKIKQVVFVGALGLLMLFDLLPVNKRYFNNQDFLSKSALEETFTETPADQQILQDKDNYRVFNLATSPFNDARDSYYHNSLGGYHGAKLKRYQELIENQLSKNNMGVLNMLNTRYVIIQGQNGQTQVQRNPEALGNAWFVANINWAKNADAEMKALDKLNTKTTAVIDQRFESDLKGKNFVADTTARIKQTSYKPNELTYESNSKTEQLAVFSEIYYRGNQDWVATIDGKQTPHVRANYVLRAMPIPAGKHQIVFKFMPKSVQNGKIYDLIASIGLVLLLGMAVWKEYKN